MPAAKNIPSSRRHFLSNSLKIVLLGTLVLPVKKTLANSAAFVLKTKNSFKKFLFADKLILNSKTKVVHLPTEKIFSKYTDIDKKHQKVIDLKTWETQVKAPVHFNKEKSGIILELLALQKLNAGITDKSLSAAINTLSLAFTPAYKDRQGIMINKHNFRLHELLVQLIALTNSIPAAQKWTKFDTATGKLNHAMMLASLKKHLPPRVKWIYSEKDFNQRVAYIQKNKTDYIGRLQKRAATYKLT